MPEDINHSGRNPTYKPELGRAGGRFDDSFVVDTSEDSYADRDELDRLLAQLLSESRKLREYAEGLLTPLAVPVRKDDTRLYDAHIQEWPKDLGKPEEFISYRYYKALRLRDTTSATYIRKRYEEAARDVNGSTAIDIVVLANILTDEAERIKEFLNDYVGRVDDSSEERIVELFQDWVEAARVHARQFRQILKKGDPETHLPPDGSEVGLSPSEAKHTQAVLKVKLNSQNDVVFKELTYVKKNFDAYAAVFYKKFLGPALKFRLDVGRTVFPMPGDSYANENFRSVKSLNGTLRAALADQYRRNLLFTNKLTLLSNLIADRDGTRMRIHDLAAAGVPVPNKGRNAMVNRSDGNDYKNVVKPHVEKAKKLKPSHDALTDRDDAQAHPQYLLRKGGELTGDLKLDKDVKIDGMRPSTHAHTGVDGTAKIHGSDIVGKTLGDDAVDTDQKPPKPTDLKLVRVINRIEPPGGVVVDIEIAWEGYPNQYTYEVLTTKALP